jgi:polar amino acid transport system substrate-binding protein
MRGLRIRGRRPLAGLLAAALIATALAGCEFPADPEGTLERAEGGVLRVGVADHPPWVELTKGAPKGVEPQLVRRFAAEIDAEIEWVEGSEAELIEALAGFQLDIVIGGFTRSSPWAKEAALTRPYVDTEVQIGVPPGAALPGEGELGGERIWVERGSPAAALLRQEEDDAIPVPFERLAEVEGPALLDTWDINTLGYERTDYILRDDEHAMAVPMGENAFLVELEHFLLDRGAEAERLLNEVAAR